MANIIIDGGVEREVKNIQAKIPEAASASNKLVDQATFDAKITAGTTDLTAGTSPLDTGVIYLVYE